MLNKRNCGWGRGVTLAGAIFLSLPAIADTITFSDSVPQQLTNWDEVLSVSQFDDSLGTLNSVEISLFGSISGDAFYESLDAAPATIMLDLSAEIGLAGLFSVFPLVQVIDSATVFDGVVDFDGGSGGTFTGLTGSISDSLVLTDPVDLLSYIGLGTLDFATFATGMSVASGAGNIVSGFNTFAGAEVEITYDFTPTVSMTEPATVLLLLGGLLGLRLKRR